MEGGATVPFLALTVDDSRIEEGAARILQLIRPCWDLKNVEYKLLTDGITNKLVACRGSGSSPGETVLIRVYGNKTDLLIDRQAETKNILRLSARSLAPELYATFRNGLAYRFVPGATLTPDSVRDPAVYSLVARRMAQLHNVPAEPAQTASIWGKIHKFLDLVPDQFTDSKKHSRFKSLGFPKSLLQAEFDALKGALAGTSSPVVFCHNDLLLGNVIYTKDTNSVTFIDYEYAAFNHQAFDIANHFLEFAGLDDVDYSRLPDEAFQRAWLRVYLQEYRPGDVTDAELALLIGQIKAFMLVSHLFWAIWALIQTEHSYIEFDFLGYGALRLQEYFRIKETHLEIVR